VTEQPPASVPGSAGSPEASSPGCWPDDSGYLAGRVWIPAAPSGDERVGCYFNAVLVDKVGNPLGRQIDISDVFQIRFRVETAPAERWTHASGTWVFDLDIHAARDSDGFSLSSRLPSSPSLQEYYGAARASASRLRQLHRRI